MLVRRSLTGKKRADRLKSKRLPLHQPNVRISQMYKDKLTVHELMLSRMNLRGRLGTRSGIEVRFSYSVVFESIVFESIGIETAVFNTC